MFIFPRPFFCYMNIKLIKDLDALPQLLFHYSSASEATQESESNLLQIWTPIKVKIEPMYPKLIPFFKNKTCT